MSNISGQHQNAPLQLWFFIWIGHESFAGELPGRETPWNLCPDRFTVVPYTYICNTFTTGLKFYCLPVLLALTGLMTEFTLVSKNSLLPQVSPKKICR